MAQPLSHIAQTVLDAVQQNCHDTDGEFAAAAIRALTEAKLPETPHPSPPDPTLFGARLDLGRWIERQHLRASFLSVAYELEKMG